MSPPFVGPQAEPRLLMPSIACENTILAFRPARLCELAAISRAANFDTFHLKVFLVHDV